MDGKGGKLEERKRCSGGKRKMVGGECGEKESKWNREKEDGTGEKREERKRSGMKRRQ